MAASSPVRSVRGSEPRNRREVTNGSAGLAGVWSSTRSRPVNSGLASSRCAQVTQSIAATSALRRARWDSLRCSQSSKRCDWLALAAAATSSAGGGGGEDKDEGEDEDDDEDKHKHKHKNKNKDDKDKNKD